MNKNTVKKDQLDAYFNEAKSWETDKLRQLNQSKKTAWIIAGTATTCAALSIFSIGMMMPLKSVEPYVIRVDNSTGMVDIVTALSDGQTTYEESVSKYFCQWYVKYREGYSKDLAEEYYSNVGIMSSGLEQQKFYEFFDPKNSNSPLNLYGQTAKVKIDIKSTTFIKKDIALVRYVKSVERGMDKPIQSHWQATITFKYTAAPTAEKDRAINPLGFQVVDFRNDPDAQTGDAILQSSTSRQVSPNRNHSIQPTIEQ